MRRRRFMNKVGGVDSKYLTIEVLENDCNIIFNSNFTIQYSTDLNTWSDLTPYSTVSANAGDKVYFKATGLTPTSRAGIGTFTVSKNFNLSGNCNSMLFGDDAATNLDLTGYSYAFYRLFYNSTTLQSVSSTFLPATTLANLCYCGMFQNCTSLTAAPDLPATSLASMCYSIMFSYCTSLTTIPELPATTLAESCYSTMFQNCTALTTAPELSATTLASHCYYSMFYGCSNLNYIKMLATDITAEDCLTDWVSGVASTGTFVKNKNATWNVTGASGVPSGWTVETASA